MTELEQPSALRRRRRRRRSGWWRIVAVIVAAALVFAIGVAVGQALEDSPAPGTTQTYVRTLEPLPQQPASTTP